MDEVTAFRMDYLNQLMDEMVETTDTTYLFELYKESHRTFSAIMESLITKEIEPIDVDGKVLNATDGVGAAILSLDEFRKKNNP